MKCRQIQTLKMLTYVDGRSKLKFSRKITRGGQVCYILSGTNNVLNYLAVFTLTKL
jgi:hypothetical protein